MSIYFVFCCKNIPEKINIILPHETIKLQQLNEKFIPEFHIAMTNKFFYFLDGEINFKRLTEISDTYSIADKFNRRFQEDRNVMFMGVLKWLVDEVRLGNSIFLIRQIETDNQDERINFNSIYDSQPFSVSKMTSDFDEIKFDFNIAYEILE